MGHSHSDGAAGGRRGVVGLQDVEILVGHQASKGDKASEGDAGGSVDGAVEGRLVLGFFLCAVAGNLMASPSIDSSLAWRTSAVKIGFSRTRGRQGGCGDKGMGKVAPIGAALVAG